MIIHCALCVYGFLLIECILSSSGTMSVDRECRMRRGGLLEPKSSSGASLEEELDVPDGLTIVQPMSSPGALLQEQVYEQDGLRAANVGVDEPGSDGLDSSVHGHAGWGHRRPWKREVEGSRATASECGWEFRLAEHRKDTSMHMHVQSDRRVAGAADISAWSAEWSNDEEAPTTHDFGGNSGKGFSESARIGVVQPQARRSAHGRRSPPSSRGGNVDAEVDGVLPQLRRSSPVRAYRSNPLP